MVCIIPVQNLAVFSLRFSLILASYLCEVLPLFLLVCIRNYPNECCRARLCIIFLNDFEVSYYLAEVSCYTSKRKLIIALI
jgi:hypothetical protein